MPCAGTTTRAGAGTTTGTGAGSPIMSSPDHMFTGAGRGWTAAGRTAGASAATTGTATGGTAWAGAATTGTATGGGCAWRMKYKIHQTVLSVTSYIQKKTIHYHSRQELFGTKFYLRWIPSLVDMDIFPYRSETIPTHDGAMLRLEKWISSPVVGHPGQPCDAHTQTKTWIG